VENSRELSAFMEAFGKAGYRECDEWQHEDGYEKIALYAKRGTTVCTHAARELIDSEEVCGKWTSKLGGSYDIQHSTPFRVEGTDYGEACRFMKRRVWVAASCTLDY
jgi:hypothetical protein